MKGILVIIIILLTPQLQVRGQEDQSQNNEGLNLGPSKDSQISNLFDLYVSKRDESRILDSRENKIYPKDPFTLTYNGDTLNIKSFHTRGNNSLKFQRKSFLISTTTPTDFDGRDLNKISLTNLVMDRNYWRNRFSYILLKQLNLFPLFNQYAELRINGKTQGVYLIIQKADDFTKSIGSEALVRRGYNGLYEIEYAKGEQAKILKKTLRKGKADLRKYSGPELESEISNILDFHQYCQWMGFNYIILNGDYSDELFFYLDDESKRFKIIPWDYDDIFSMAPHEGWVTRNENLKNDLIFSSEAYFDRVIDHDPYLYDYYLTVLQELLERLNDKIVKAAFEQVYSELLPFFEDHDILDQSTFDQSGETDLDQLTSDLQKNYSYLQTRLKSLVEQIEIERSSISR